MSFADSLPVRFCADTTLMLSDSPDPIPQDVGAVVLYITREEVEACDTSAAAAALQRLLRDRDTVIRFRGRVSYFVEEYGSADPRQIDAAPDVRAYFETLDQSFPYWFYFLERTSSSLVRLIAWLSGGLDGDVEKCMSSHFRAVDSLWEQFQLPGERIALTWEMGAYLLAHAETALEDFVAGRSRTRWN